MQVQRGCNRSLEEEKRERNAAQSEVEVNARVEGGSDVSVICGTAKYSAAQLSRAEQGLGR